MNVANNVIMSGSNVYISESDSITTVVGELNVDNKMVMNGANVYISNPSGKFEVVPPAKLSDLEVTGATVMADMNLSGNLVVGSHFTQTAVTANNVINGMFNVLGNTSIGTDTIEVTIDANDNKNTTFRGIH